MIGSSLGEFRQGDMDCGYTGPGIDETYVQIPLGHELLDHSRKIQGELLVPQHQAPLSSPCLLRQSMFVDLAVVPWSPHLGAKQR